MDVWTDNWLPYGCPIIYHEDMFYEFNIKLVCDLILHAGGGCNKGLVEFVLCTQTTTQILALPLSRHGGSYVLYLERWMVGTRPNQICLYLCSFGWVYDFNILLFDRYLLAAKAMEKIVEKPSLALV